MWLGIQTAHLERIVSYRRNEGRSTEAHVARLHAVSFNQELRKPDRTKH